MGIALIFRGIDEAVLMLFEHAAHAWERRTGATAFWLARTFAGLSLILLFSSGVRLYIERLSLGENAFGPIFLFFIASSGFFWLFVRKAEREEADWRGLAGRSNPSRERWVLRLLLSWAIAGLAILAATRWNARGSLSCLLVVLGCVAWFAAIYFSAATPLSPGKSGEKIGE